MALSLANCDACDYSAELAAEKELHQSLEKKVFDIQLQKTLMRNKLQQVIDGLLPSSYGSPAGIYISYQTNSPLQFMHDSCIA